MSEAQTPELISRLAYLKRKSSDGEITMEEMREGIRLLRQGRIAAQEAAKASKSRAKAPKGPERSTESLLKDIGI